MPAGQRHSAQDRVGGERQHGEYYFSCHTFPHESNPAEGTPFSFRYASYPILK